MTKAELIDAVHGNASLPDITKKTTGEIIDAALETSNRSPRGRPRRSSDRRARASTRSTPSLTETVQTETWKGEGKGQAWPSQRSPSPSRPVPP